MSKLEVGQTVRFRIGKERVFGVVKTDAVLTATGPAVKVKLLPDFAHLLPTGWTDAGVDELIPVKVCACAHLAYRPIWGDHKGELFTTGCDFSRMPGRNSKFLPGHDAKAKGFLIKASGLAQTLENGLGALETARELGDKISLAVAKGMDNERKRSATRRTSTADRVAPARREDLRDDIDQLRAKLGITDTMSRALAHGVVNDTPGFQHKVYATAGTRAALAKRGLTTPDGYLTNLGCKVTRTPTLAEDNPAAVVCKDDQGGYAGHSYRWDGDQRACTRCGDGQDS